jgi:hypothetical protein
LLSLSVVRTCSTFEMSVSVCSGLLKIKVTAFFISQPEGCGFESWRQTKRVNNIAVN